MMGDKILLRLLLIGKSEVGKTSIMLKYIENLFLTDYIRTIAVDCKSKSSLIQGKFTKTCIFDSPGDEEFSTLTPAYWHLADIIVLVASFDDYKSFEFIKEKENTIFKQAESQAQKVILLNKCDLKDDPRNDFEDEVKIWAEQENIQFYSCSASEGDSVVDIFDKIIDNHIKDKNPQDPALSHSNSKKRFKCLII